jgi:DNA-binding LytR/AlgR family response regulator
MVWERQQAAAAPPPESIFVKSEYKLVQILLDNIRYIEGLKDYVKIYTDDQPRPVLTLMSMKALEEQLPASRFMRVHRSYIVNLAKIRDVKRGRIGIDDVYIPVGDSYKAALQAYIDKR